jgi:hypothetical protein
MLSSRSMLETFGSVPYQGERPACATFDVPDNPPKKQDLAPNAIHREP